VAGPGQRRVLCSTHVEPLLSGWRRTFTADGVILAPPQPEGGGRVRIRPRLEPLRSVRSLANEFLTPPPPGAPAPEVEGPFGLSTAEGEYAAMVSEIVRPIPGQALQRTACFIMGDDWFAQIDGVTDQPALFTLFRRTIERLAYGHCLGLGTDRWRRFFHDPPPRWSGIGRGRSVAWIPPDHPRNPAVLRVYDARPSRSTGSMLLFRRLFEQLPREFGERPPSPPVTLHTRHGLQGELVTYSRAGCQPAGMLMASDAVLADVRYLYLLRLESDEPHFAENSAAFLEVLDSVRPLPTPSEVDALLPSATSDPWSD
jgi:hypothetical protein